MRRTGKSWGQWVEGRADRLARNKMNRITGDYLLAQANSLGARVDAQVETRMATLKPTPRSFWDIFS
jgi:hypothetical protein